MKFNPENQNWIKLAKIGLKMFKIDQKIPHFGSYWEILIVLFDFIFFIFWRGVKGRTKVKHLVPPFKTN